MSGPQPYAQLEIQQKKWVNSSNGAWVRFEVHVDDIHFFDGQDGVVFTAVLFKQEQLETIAKSAEEKQKHVGEYGHFASVLDKAKLWQHHRIIKLSGTDADYQAWCHHQTCAISGGKGEFLRDKGEWRCQYAHINFSDNSGIGIKNAEYSGLPMTYEMHIDRQHKQGIEALKKPFIDSKKQHERYKDTTTKEILQMLVRKYNGKWAREAFRQKHFEVDSWTKVVPQQFMTKMRELGVADLVPQDYEDSLSYWTY